MKISCDAGCWIQVVCRTDGFDPAVARDLIEDLDESRRALNRIANDLTLDAAAMIRIAREVLGLPELPR
jgi:hypothetical protein